MLLDFQRVAILPNFFLCSMVDGRMMRDPAFTEQGKGEESKKGKPLMIEETELFEKCSSSFRAANSTKVNI